jgi:hypothetical protein
MLFSKFAQWQHHVTAPVAGWILSQFPLPAWLF